MINRSRKEWIDKARDVAIEDEIARRGIRLKRITATEFAGACPQCGGEDRFSINTKDQVFNCRGCGGKGKGAIDLVMFLDGIRLNDACEKLVGPAPKPNGRGPVRTGTWIYRDADGRPYLRVSRLDYPDGAKQYPQSRWDGQWVKGKPDGPKLPYRLPELLDSDRTEPVYICEGEKCADAVAALGLAATSASEGACKWTADLNEWFRDRIAYILPDKDEPGLRHARLVAQNLSGFAREIRIVELPGLSDGEDVFDWIARGATRGQLDELGAGAPVWSRAEVAEPIVAAPADVEFEEFNKEGVPKTSCANARIAIVALGVECRHDQFHDKLIVGGHVIGQHVGELSDHACHMLRIAIHKEWKFDPGRNHTFDAAVQLCLQHPFDPIVEYLDALQWDGTKRIDTWMRDYLGADDTDLNSTIGRLVLLAMVRRARRPGCKFDQIIVLEGHEGKLKSTALTVLAGAEENFSDQTILGLSDQQQQERLRGKWVYEIGDLSGIRKAEVESIKAFASRTHDRARPAYGRQLVELPRRCVIFGTTNDSTYLKSRTGNRRFWPVKTGTIDIDALRHDRDQLLAEAATVEATGCSLTLPQELWAAAKAEQDERLEHDPWIDKLESLQGTVYQRADGRGDEERISCDEILSLKLNIPAERQTDTISKRLAFVMRDLGWEGPDKIRFGYGRNSYPQRGYRRAVRP